MTEQSSTRASVVRAGGYIPATRIARSAIAAIWGSPAIPGERALAAVDEDAVTMAVEAATNCLYDFDRSQIDAVYLATTSAPYAQKQTAAIVASALDLRYDVVTSDFGDSLRAATLALRAAADAVRSGALRHVLVVAADRRVAEPESIFEQLFGDAAAAVLIGPEGPGSLAVLGQMVSLTEEVSSGWRAQGDPYFRSYSVKHEIDYGFTRPLARAVQLALDAAGLTADDVTKLVVPSPDGRAHLAIAKLIGLHPQRVAEPQSFALGTLATPAPLVALCGALEDAVPGDRIVLGAAGEGADAVVLDVLSPVPESSWRLSDALNERRVVSSYGDYIRANKLMDTPAADVVSSPIIYWRDRDVNLSLHGMRCEACGLVQYPTARVCQRCHAKDRGVEVPLSRTGTIFTYTLDHIVAATYSTVPVGRAIVDLDGGGRILTQLVDCDGDKLQVGTPVRLSFRVMSEGGGFKHYYWKAAPVG
jgi:3-hydroxy-3-methylglutaryl CoA synthase